MAAVVRDELGALLDSWPTGKWRLARGKEILHRFEHGLVLDRGAKRGPLALPYRDLRIYREFNPTFSRGRTIVVFDWTFESSDGQTWTTPVEESRKGKRSALPQMYKEALGQTCARQREAAVQRLGEGAALAFGPVELDRSQISVGGRGTAPWTRVIELSVKPRGHRPTLVVKVGHDGRFVKERNLEVHMAKIPNFPLLWELAHLAHAHAQAAQ